jgi:hypothetical protein
VGKGRAVEMVGKGKSDLGIGASAVLGKSRLWKERSRNIARYGRGHVGKERGVSSCRLHHLPTTHHPLSLPRSRRNRRYRDAMF